MKTLKGPAIFLAQFMGDAEPFNSLESISKYMADLGYLGVYWAGPDGRSRQNDPTSLPGFIGFDEVVGRYADRTGRDTSSIGYYVAFSCWRLAVISEGVYARYLHGAMGAQLDRAAVDQFRGATEELATRALDLLGPG